MDCNFRDLPDFQSSEARLIPPPPPPQGIYQIPHLQLQIIVSIQSFKYTYIITKRNMTLTYKGITKNYNELSKRSIKTIFFFFISDCKYKIHYTRESSA